MLSRYRRGLLAAIAVVAIVSIVSVIWVVAARPGRGGDQVTAGSDPRVSTAVATASTPVCGFDGPLVSKITADRPAGGDGPTLTSWSAEGDGGLSGIAVAGSEVVVGRDLDGGRSEFLRFSLDGRSEGRFTVDIDHEDRWTLADDGSLYLVDSTHGSTRRIVHLAADGSRLGSFEVPKSSETTGNPQDLRSVVWTPRYQGAAALLIGEGTHTVHAVRPGGDDLGLVKDVPDELGNGLGNGLIAGFTYTKASTPLTTLDVVDPASGADRMHAVYPADQGGGDQGDGRSTTPAPFHLASVVPGPGGDGFLLSTAYGVQWLDERGVRKGVWLAGQDGFSPAEPASMAEMDGRYWMLVKTGDDGRESVATLSSTQMRARLAAPLNPNADVETDLAQLGLGIGAITRVPFGHFDAGRKPAVYLRTERGWGDLPGAPRPPLEVRYTITGDPTLADPVTTTRRSAAIPWGGGETPLQLPPARPGAYAVDLSVVDTSTGTVLSGACLRYSIGAPGADLALGTLAKGDDWGGPGPLRGAQLAASLGIGSSRVQLDFGSMISDPTAQPSADLVDWTSVPGAGLSDDQDADPFQDLRAAGAYAAAHHVRLIVQVGSGGDAEKAAISAGTWAGWVRVIVGEFAREAPDITSWEPFNEPNNTDLKADAYWKTVEIPFADAAHAARAGTYVIGGNTLGFDTGWWKRAAADGVCTHIDAIGVHPYTGWNRSWEEEGFEKESSGWSALARVIGPACGRLPRWDTESGWTADGAVAYWDQGSNVARKLLWNRQEGIAGWTYFFSEGGWGENDLSWSLIQYESYVKPGGLAFATVSRLLASRGKPTVVATSIPFVHVMRVPGDDTMIAAWADEARVPVDLETGATSIGVTDEYGATTSLAVSGGLASATLTAAPQFFRVPAGSAISVAAVEPFGPDLLRGQKVTASSTHEDADPQVITSGTADPDRPWRSGAIHGGIDPHPSVTIPLRSPTTIDRVAVATTNIACCEAGLRGYTVSVQRTDGSWTVVAQPKDQFWERTAVVRFDPVEAKAVRVEAVWTTVRGVKVLDMNYTGFSGGLPPPFMGLQTNTDYVMSVSAVSAWAPATPR